MIKNSTMEYSAPNCKVLSLAPRKVVCTSPGAIDPAQEEEYGEY